jgi:uncharacterized integral membrane protein
MTNSSNKKNISNKNLLLQYAGIGAQIVAGLLIFIFAGKWIDSKLQLSFPMLIWLLPLIFIVGMIVKVIKDTSNKKDE